MAKKKPAPSPVSPRTTAALSHGQAAEGAKYLRQGFSFSPEEDLAFALGYPHLRYLVDGHPDDQEAEAVARSFFNEITPFNERLELPREVAMRLARALGNDAVSYRIVPDANAKNGVRNEWSPAAESVFATAGPIGEEEASGLIGAALVGECTYAPQVLVFILEAVHGSEAVGEWLAAAMEMLEAPPSRSKFLIYQLGFMFLRMRPAKSAALRARTEAVFVRWAKASGFELPLPKYPENCPNPPWVLRMLDVLLHGRAGAERSLMPLWGGGLDTQGLAHVLDDPAYVRAMVEQEPKPPSASRDYLDARLAFLGGPKVVELYATRVSRLKSAGERIRFIETFGAIRAPDVVARIVELSATPKARKQAYAWFAAHAEYARPIVEQLARGGGEHAAAATAMLE